MAGSARGALALLAVVAAGCALRGGPGDIAAEAAAMRARLGDYLVVEGTAPGDGDTAWAAYVDDAGVLRYVRETSRSGTGTEAEYWFEGRRLLAHLSRDAATGDTVYLGFDRAGALAERARTADGRAVPIDPADVAWARARAAVLAAEARRAVAVPPGLTALAFTTSRTRVGRMTLEGTTLRFAACGERGKGVVVQDFHDGRGASLIRDLGGAARPVSVVVRMEEDRLREIRYAADEGPGCGRLPPPGDVEARGNEPFWRLGADGGEAVLRTPEEPEGVVFRGGSWRRPAQDRWVYEARRGTAAGVEHLTLELTEARCIDDMSGARYPLRALLRREGVRLHGCALEGQRTGGGAAAAAR